MTAAVLEVTPAEWQEKALAWIESYAAAGAPFSADDIRDKIPAPHHPSLWGAVFRAACTRGLITTCGFQESSTPSRKRGVVRVWQRASKS